MLAMPSMPSPPLLAPMAPATCSPRPPLAGRPRPNMILPLAKVFNVAASQDHDAPQIRDFYGLAFKGNNPHETQFHMQARLGFRRPKPQGIRLRPVQRGCSTKEVVLERHRNRKAAKAAKAAQAVAKADERRTALALHAQKASSKGFERGTTKAADPMAMSFASSFGRPTTALEPGESDQNYGQVSYDMVGAAVQEALDEDDASDLEDGSIVEMQTPLTNPKMAQSKSQPKGRQKTAEEKELEEAEWDDDHVNAATKLQAKMRGNATRKQMNQSQNQPKGKTKTAEELEVEAMEFDDDHAQAAVKLQAKLRGNSARKDLESKKAEKRQQEVERQEEEKAAIKIQAIHRGNKSRADQ